jgi:hypothetical protein
MYYKQHEGSSCCKRVASSISDVINTLPYPEQVRISIHLYSECPRRTELIQRSSSRIVPS